MSGMTREREVWGAAKMLVDQHGELAGPDAAVRAARMLDARDGAGASFWTMVEKAIGMMRDGASGLPN